MTDTVNCPSCDRPLRVPGELLGHQVKCPACGTAFLADLGGPAPPPRRAERPPEPRSERVRGREDDEDRFPPRRRTRYDEEDEDYDEGRPRRSRRYLQPHRGGMILTMGILSLFIMHIILGPLAWVMGNNDLREMRAGRMDPEGESQTSTGRLLGIIGTSIGALAIVGTCLFVGLMFLIGASGASRPPGPPPRRF
jgi:hypothetical protein